MSQLTSLISKLKDDLDSEIENSADSMFDVPGAARLASKDEWAPTAKQLQIIAILKETPMLTDWTLNKLLDLQARIKNVTLREMYTPTQLKALADSLCESDEDRAVVYANFGLGEIDG